MPSKLRCSGLGVMRGTAKAFMSRHGDSSYAKQFNTLQDRYRCQNIAKLEFLPSSNSTDNKIMDVPTIAADGSCLTIAEISSMGNWIEKQCGETYIHIRAH